MTLRGYIFLSKGPFFTITSQKTSERNLQNNLTKGFENLGRFFEIQTRFLLSSSASNIEIFTYKIFRLGEEEE